MEDQEKFYETSIPEIEDFYSNLIMKVIDGGFKPIKRISKDLIAHK